MDATDGKRLLITGASGTLGSVLAERAVAAGWDVSAAYFSRPERVRAGKPIQLDLRDGDATAAVVAEAAPDVVIHTAITERSGEGYACAIELAARHISQAVTAIAGRLVALSTDLVFDGTQVRYTEDSPPYPLPGADYGAAKAAAEQIIAAQDPTAAIVRTSIIYDFCETNPQVDWMLRRIAAGEDVPLFVDQVRCPIWAHNLADALLELACRTYTGVLHIVGPEPMTRYELGCGLLDALGLDASAHVRVAYAPDSMPPRLILDVTQTQDLLETPLLSFAAAREMWEVRRAQP